MKEHWLSVFHRRAVWVVLAGWMAFAGTALATTLVDTGQTRCYNDRETIPCPKPGQAYYGQDAQYRSLAPAFRDNGNGTVTDLVTGLTWSKGVNARKVSLEEAERIAAGMTLGGYSDWRVPTIKELYSLIDFRGYTGFARPEQGQKPPTNAIPYINTDVFDFAYGKVEEGERYIDAQWLSRTRYVSTTMDGAQTLFGVNFADGRIKGYGYRHPGRRHGEKKFYARYVRGPVYGQNLFVDNGDGTVTDRATGLMWMKVDSGRPMSWKEALAYAESLRLAGNGDWRLPNAKELQSIVDYSRSPDTTDSAAIDPVFQTTAITNEGGQPDFPFYWTSTTHLDGPTPGSQAVYVAFGRAMGSMHGRVMDVHGAGAQRSDPKTGRAQIGHGPQGDAQRVLNFVRCVRRGSVTAVTPHAREDRTRYPGNVASHPTASRVPGYPSGRTGVEGAGSPGLPVRRQGGFVQRLDRDDDGRVSRAEFDGPPDRFDDHDRNGDGYLSADEAPMGPPPGGPAFGRGERP